MGKTVEQGEKADQSHAGGNRQPGIGCNQQAKHEHGGGDTLLDSGNDRASVPERRPENHHANEGRWHEPSRMTAKLRGPKPDGDHRQNMVNSRERMSEAGAEIPCHVPAFVPRMRLGERGE